MSSEPTFESKEDAIKNAFYSEQTQDQTKIEDKKQEDR